MTISQAIRTLGLEPARKAYNGEIDYFFQRALGSNWNLIGSGGVIVAALAIADTDYQFATSMINYAANNLMVFGMQGYRTDGGWDEGIGCVSL